MQAHYFPKKQTIKITKENKKKISNKNEMKNKHTNKKDMIWGCRLTSTKFNIFNHTIVALLFKLEAPVFYSLGPKRVNFSYYKVIPNVSRLGQITLSGLFLVIT